jgi:pimeloyl-ACP methyl ester carboxylesterase
LNCRFLLLFFLSQAKKSVGKAVQKEDVLLKPDSVGYRYILHSRFRFLTRMRMFMMPSVILCVGLLLGGAPTVDSFCHLATAPSVPLDGKWVRKPDKNQAIVLIHGYYFHFTDKNVSKPALRPWQKPDNPLITELAKTADVFVFAYGQNASIDAIAKESKLGDSVALLRKQGYKEIILVGHSAGGLIARHFIEDNPDCGVTRVVQVCAPNGGTPLAGARVPKSQKVFIECLTEECRKECQKEREKKRVPMKIQFACVVAKSDPKATTDGIVPSKSQWTPDLQKQGIPAFGLVGGHREVVHSAKHAEALARVIRNDHGRWNAEQVDKARKELFAP